VLASIAKATIVLH